MAVLQPVARPESADAQLVALRVPPHSIEAEQALLGALLIDNQAFDKIGDLLTGEDFYRDDHRRIWRHIVKMVENNQPADVVTVALRDRQSGGRASAVPPAARTSPRLMIRSRPVRRPGNCSARSRCPRAAARTAPATWWADLLGDRNNPRLTLGVLHEHRLDLPP